MILIIKKNDTLYYFDFETNKWLECSYISSYPYELFEYKIKSSNKTFITCQDSYRLIESLKDAPPYYKNDERKRGVLSNCYKQNIHKV